MKIELTDKNVKYLGRTAMFGDTLLLSLSGSGIEFEYTGKGLEITFVGGNAAELPDNEANYVRIGIFENGIRTRDLALNKKELRVKIAESAITKTSVIRIMKLSECAMSLMGIKPLEIADNDTVKPIPASAAKLEFIGDSITCGYGVDDPDPTHNFKTLTEDVTKGFAYKTAAALNCDHSMFSISGYGIISGFTDNPEFRHADQLIPTFYESMGLSYDKLDGIPVPHAVRWDFSKYIPDIIVLNLGTNDDSFCQDDKDRQSWYASKYTEFLKLIRKHNQKAYIVCAFGLMGDRLYPTICDAVGIYKAETGDTRIQTVHLPEQDFEHVGYGADYHPLESEHEKAAKVLIPVLSEIIEKRL
ncbi:MAG: lipase [Lachnospiraceae bacterium]|nr:lipase [Lachnospiraceae bacterium]